MSELIEELVEELVEGLIEELAPKPMEVSAKESIGDLGVKLGEESGNELV